MEKGLEKVPNFFVIKNGVVLNKQVFESKESAQEFCGADASIVEITDENAAVREGYLWDGASFTYAEPVFNMDSEPVTEE